MKTPVFALEKYALVTLTGKTPAAFQEVTRKYLVKSLHLSQLTYQGETISLWRATSAEARSLTLAREENILPTDIMVSTHKCNNPVLVAKFITTCLTKTNGEANVSIEDYLSFLMQAFQTCPKELHLEMSSNLAELVVAWHNEHPTKENLEALPQHLLTRCRYRVLV